MNEQTPTKELYSALQAASADIGMAHKSEVNSHDRYKYADLEDYLSAIRPACVKHGLYCYSRPIGNPQYFDRKTSSNAVHQVCRIQVEAVVVHPDSGGALAVAAWGEGQDRADKSLYKAITGGRKYSLAMLFGIHTTDDAEKDSPEESTSTTPQARPPQPAPAQPQQPTAPQPTALDGWKSSMAKKGDLAELLGWLKQVAAYEPLTSHAELYRQVLEAFAEMVATRRDAGSLPPGDADILRQRIVAVAQEYDQAHPGAMQ